MKLEEIGPDLGLILTSTSLIFIASFKGENLGLLSCPPNLTSNFKFHPAKFFRS